LVAARVQKLRLILFTAIVALLAPIVSAAPVGVKAVIFVDEGGPTCPPGSTYVPGVGCVGCFVVCQLPPIQVRASPAGLVDVDITVYVLP